MTEKLLLSTLPTPGKMDFHGFYLFKVRALGCQVVTQKIWNGMLMGNNNVKSETKDETKSETESGIKAGIKSGIRQETTSETISETEKLPGEKPVTGCLAGAAALLLADRVTKHLALGALSGSRSVKLIPGVLELALVKNQGAAFGLGQGGGYLFAGAALVICGIILVCLLQDRPAGAAHPLAVRISLAMIMAGAAGNAIDRVTWHYVVDFIYIRLIDFPVFNVADICVTAGCVILAAEMLLGSRAGGDDGGSTAADADRRGEHGK